MHMEKLFHRKIEKNVLFWDQYFLYLAGSHSIASVNLKKSIKKILYHFDFFVISTKISLYYMACIWNKSRLALYKGNIITTNINIWYKNKINSVVSIDYSISMVS